MKQLSKEINKNFNLYLKTKIHNDKITNVEKLFKNRLKKNAFFKSVFCFLKGGKNEH